MQFKTFTLSTLLLALPEAVFTTQGDVRYVKALRISDKNSFSLNFQPRYFADPVEGKSLAKRQFCLGGETPCYGGCCKVGTYCDISDGEAGCCRIGKICVSECRDFYNVNCKTYCCLKGTTCGPNETCKRETDGDPRCDAGYSLCAEFYGCCPNGVRCILPRYCAIPCATDHPKCGNGCCEKGYYCTEDQMCARLNRYTSLVGLTTTRQIYTDYPTKTLVYTVTIFDSTPTETKPSSKSIYVPPISSSSSSGDTTKLQTHTYTPWQLPAPTAVSGAAPAMCAMLDGLGMAAGILGVFAM